LARSPSLAVAAAFAGCCAIWGSTFLVIRLGSQTVPPFWAAAVRLALATTLLIPLARLVGQPLPRGGAFRSAAVFGALQFGFQFCFLYWGETQVPSGLTAVFYATIPLTTALLARAFGLEALNTRRVLGGLLALTGVALIFGGQWRAGVSAVHMVALLAAATVAAFSTVWLKRGPRLAPVALNAVACPFGLLVCLVFSFASGESHAIPTTWPQLAPILYLTLAGSLGAFLLFTWLVNHWEATRISYIAVVVPVVALFLGTFAAGERLGAGEWLGSAIVLSGVALGLFGPRPSGEAATA